MKPKSKNHNQYFCANHLTDGIGDRTAQGGLVTIFFHGGKFAVSIIATMILARLLTPSDYGLIVMVGVITNFASLFKDAGLGTATIQKTDINHDQVSVLFWINMAISFVIMLVTMAMAPAVAAFYGEPRLTMITIVAAIGFLIGGLSVQHEALLNRQMRFFSLSCINFVSTTLGYAVGIGLAWSGIGYWALVFSQLTVLTTFTVGVWLACRWWPGKPNQFTEVKSMLSIGGGVTGYSTINYISRNIDNLLIGHLLGAQQLGFYNKAIQLLGLLTDQIKEPVGSVTVPALSRLTQDPERYRGAYLRIVEKVVMVTMPVIAVMILTADWIVSLMLGQQWEEAVPIFVCLGFSGLFQSVINTVGWLLATQGRSRDLVKWSMLINAPISIISILVGLYWGSVGVAASYSLARIFILLPLTFWFVGRSGPVQTKDFYRLLMPFVLATGMGMLACYWYRDYAAIDNPILGITSNSVLMGSVSLLVLCLIPSGRSTLLDMRTLLPSKSRPSTSS